MARMMDSLRDAWSGAASAIDASVNESVVRLAITGLSRAGKTVFITSLIRNLLAAGSGLRTLPAFQKQFERSDGSNRLKSVTVRSAGAGAVPYFDYARKFADLAADTPAWPPRTEDLATITLELDIERDGPVGSRLGLRRVRLDILDYPGEWLLDLPLRQKSFATWSDETLALIRQAPRAELFRAFLRFLGGFDPAAPAVDQQLQEGHRLYRNALDACRIKLGLRYLQPGRFLCPGPRGDAPFMWFFPCDPLPGGAPRGSALSLLQHRYEAYKADIAASFFDTHFVDFERQIILVDVLSALHAGRTAFEDTERAIAEISASMSHGRNLPPIIGKTAGVAIQIGALALDIPFLGRRVSATGDRLTQSVNRRSIERVAFVATKADHVPAMKRDNLRNLLRAVVEGAAKKVETKAVTYAAAAAMMSTRDETKVVGERTVEVVVGVPLGETMGRAFYPGEVPSSRPPDNFWSNRFFDLPVFTPPRLDPTGKNGILQLCIDEVLRDVLAGRL